jgi:hypothetical protein
MMHNLPISWFIQSAQTSGECIASNMVCKHIICLRPVGVNIDLSSGHLQVRGVSLEEIFLKATITDIIEAPIDRIWAIVSDFGGLMRWHPMVVRCETAGQGVGALRTVHFADWWAVERLESLDAEAHVVGYAVTDCSRPQNTGVTGRITLSEAGPGRTCLEWVAGLEADNEHADVVNAALLAYYPVRIGHLRVALGLTS